jgi:hypothetical protein
MTERTSLDPKANATVNYVFNALTNWGKKNEDERDAISMQLLDWFKNPKLKITEYTTNGEAKEELQIRLQVWYEKKWSKWVQPLFIPPERCLLVSRKLPEGKEKELIDDTTAFFFDIHFRGCELTVVTPENWKEWNYAVNVPASPREINAMKRANLDVRRMPSGVLEFKVKAVLKLKDPNMKVTYLTG